MKKGRLQELAGEFYEAVLTPTRWPEVVKLTCTIFDVPYALVYSPFAARIGLDPLWIHNADPELIETYVAKYAHDDLVAQAQWRLMPADRLTATYRELIGDDVWEAWGFYQELCKPRGVWNGITVAVQATDYRATNLTLFTPPWSAGREARAKAALCWLADHFDRAVRLHWKVSAGQRQDVAARISLDLLDVGVVWLSAQKEVLFCNREARRILDFRDGLALGGGKLIAWSEDDAGKITQAVTEVRAGGARSISITRPSDQPPFACSVIPLPLQANAFRLANAAAIMFVRERRSPDPRAVGSFASEQRLTPAEARVMQHLAWGEDAKSIAANAGVSLSTIRSQIRAIFAKTGCNRQTELIRRVASLPQVADAER